MKSSVAKCPNPITGSASLSGNLSPKTVPNSLPPKYHKKIAASDQATALLKNCFGNGKKLWSINQVPDYQSTHVEPRRV